MGRKIGILGGTFDPVHLGHMLMASYAMSELNLDSVCFVPSGNPPHKDSKNVTDKYKRLEMTRLMTDGNERFTVSDFEVNREKKSYSVDMIEHFKKELNAEIHFIIGADSLSDLPMWHDYKRLLSLCHFVVFDRPGKGNEEFTKNIDELKSHGCDITHVQMPYIGINSTEIRSRVKNGLPIRYMTDEKVERYIYDNNLYGGIR